VALNRLGNELGDEELRETDERNDPESQSPQFVKQIRPITRNVVEFNLQEPLFFVKDLVASAQKDMVAKVEELLG
jgi:hypothetical protein